jgi:catechol 2,3-dioxygenase-like lactoylglutathione lyase family enzyme
MKNVFLSILLFLQIVALAQTVEPIMLDDIHYYVYDRDATNAFFKKHFKAKAMREESPNPFKFIDFLLIRKGQSTINVSGKGPFDGIRVGDPKRWEKNNVPPSAEAPPQYGVYWLGFSCQNLAKTVKKLEKKGVVFIDKNFKLPTEPNVKAAICWGPEFNRLVIVERSDSDDKFNIDHLQLLVRNTDDNCQFLEGVFTAKTVDKMGKTATVAVAKHTFIVSEPEDLGLKREQVQLRDSKKFVSSIDHLGFMYPSVKPAYDQAVAKGFKFLSPPIDIVYFDKPTLYKFAILFSPDGLQFEMFEEKGRLASRTKAK